MQAHVDAFSGASGDMLLGAVLDAGVDRDALSQLLAGLGLDGWSLSVEPVLRGGIAATRVDVSAVEDGVVRTWGNIRELLVSAPLPELVRAHALGACRRLAEAESRIHRIDVERVHFHEIGGMDAIVDVVGVCAGLHLLGVERMTCGPVAQGVGMTRGAHGMVPVPAPAVLELLRGAPTYATGEPSALCTPTGAALLAEWVDEWLPMPCLRIDAVGYGAGIRDLGRPNVLRLVLGQSADIVPERRALLLEATIGDLPDDVVHDVLDALRDAGAGQAWATPVLIQQGRPGLEVACLADPQRAEALRRVLFTRTATPVVRGRLVDQWSLENPEAEVADPDKPGHHVAPTPLRPDGA